MIKVTAILMVVLVWQTNTYCQDNLNWEKEANYVPELIMKGFDWREIVDSIEVNYPIKKRELREVLNTIEHLKTLKTDSVSISLDKFFESDYEVKSIFMEFNSLGKSSIPGLIKYLDKDYASRWVYTSFDWVENSIYLCISDIAIKIIEDVSGIYFYTNSASPLRRFSDSPAEERQKVSESIEKWYEKTKALSKIEGINSYLEPLNNDDLGREVFTAKNLAVLGDTTNGIKYLERMYSNYKLPCRTNFVIVDIVNELGKDLALKDCLRDIYDFRCMTDNGIGCVFHIFQNAKSNIPFDVLADIVSTERFSQYKKESSEFIWHYIFNQLAISENLSTKSIIIELLKIENEVKDSKIISYNWKVKYKDQFESRFRVCDFALYKMSELFPEMDISVDWKSRESIDKVKNKIIKENGGNN